MFLDWFTLGGVLGALILLGVLFYICKTQACGA